MLECLTSQPKKQKMGINPKVHGSTPGQTSFFFCFIIEFLVIFLVKITFYAKVTVFGVYLSTLSSAPVGFAQVGCNELKKLV